MMSETTSAKEMDERERFRPSASEIMQAKDNLIECCGWASIDDDDLREAVDEWIEAETELRMAADYADKLPFRRK